MSDERVLVTCLEKLPSGVRAARDQLDALFVAGKAGVRGVSIALHRDPEVDRQHLDNYCCKAAGLLSSSRTCPIFVSPLSIARN
jgi:hypothetical protein